MSFIGFLIQLLYILLFPLVAVFAVLEAIVSFIATFFEIIADWWKEIRNAK